MNYWVCKDETINLSHLNIEDQMQEIFNHFNTNINVLDSRFDSSTFCPLLLIRASGRKIWIKITRESLFDIIYTLENYDNIKKMWGKKKYLFYLSKDLIDNGFLKFYTKILR